MALAVMLQEDRDALICDMAETYHILDIWALPVELLAVLASGLRENSRIKMKISGINYLPLEIIVPHIADALTMLFRKKEAAKPTLFTDLMLGKVKKKETESFATGADFDAQWQRIIRSATNG